MNILEINTWIGEIEVDILQTKTLYEYYQTIIPVSVNKEINTSIDWCGITVKCNYFSTCIQLDTIALNGLHALTGGNREVFDKLLIYYFFVKLYHYNNILQQVFPLVTYHLS